MALWQEYAIEPSLFEDYQQGRYIIRGFGVGEGRLIAGFPRKWQRAIRRQMSGYTDMQRKALTERLIALNNVIVARSHPYDGDRDWREQAFECHKANPFHALLLNGTYADAAAIDATMDVDNEALWEANRRISVPRQAEDLGNTLAFLLAECRDLIIADHVFNPGGGTNDKWLNPIWSLSCRCAQNESLRSITVHCLDKDRDPWPEGRFVDVCGNRLPEFLPADVVLRACLWRQREGGLQFHERLIVTDIGGVVVDPGIDEGKAGETYDLRLLSDTEIGSYFERFDKTTAEYDLVDECEIVGLRNK